MKRLPLLLIVSILYFLLSCSNGKTESQKKTTLTSTLASGQTALLINEQKRDTVKYDFNYFYSNDTICQVIYIKVLNKSKKYDIPEKLKFNLVLKNRLKKSYADIKGIATLTSPNESFSDDTESDGGAYFAADYNKNNTGYTINIALDIETYKACAVSIKPDTNNTLEDYINYLKKYPNYEVMKKGDCK
jgi:hypothetical protein